MESIAADIPGSSLIRFSPEKYPFVPAVLQRAVGLPTDTFTELPELLEKMLSADGILGFGSSVLSAGETVRVSGFRGILGVRTLCGPGRFPVQMQTKSRERNAFCQLDLVSSPVHVVGNPQPSNESLKPSRASKSIMGCHSKSEPEAVQGPSGTDLVKPCKSYSPERGP
ncbi:unnamed protein product [Symbiodinium natans]|uniref:Uncharacterized protein n=1 Tax=Symbiodinium natans TaxID=878477 RepID=A0A812L8X4_9DINO|nr:unnamed protein product [Symbiodinium natans]